MAAPPAQISKSGGAWPREFEITVGLPRLEGSALFLGEYAMKLFVLMVYHVLPRPWDHGDVLFCYISWPIGDFLLKSLPLGLSCCCITKTLGLFLLSPPQTKMLRVKNKP